MDDEEEVDNEPEQWENPPPESWQQADEPPPEPEADGQAPPPEQETLATAPESTQSDVATPAEWSNYVRKDEAPDKQTPNWYSKGDYSGEPHSDVATPEEWRRFLSGGENIAAKGDFGGPAGGVPNDVATRDEWEKFQKQPDDSLMGRLVRGVTEAPPEVGFKGGANILSRAYEGVKQGFGSEPLGISPQHQADYPFLQGPGYVWPLKTVDLILRGIMGAFSGGAGAMAAAYENITGDKSGSKQLERDINTEFLRRSAEVPGAILPNAISPKVREFLDNANRIRGETTRGGIDMMEAGERAQTPGLPSPEGPFGRPGEGPPPVAPPPKPPDIGPTSEPPKTGFTAQSQPKPAADPTANERGVATLDTERSANTYPKGGYSDAAKAMLERGPTRKTARVTQEPVDELLTSTLSDQLGAPKAEPPALAPQPPPPPAPVAAPATPTPPPAAPPAAPPANQFPESGYLEQINQRQPPPAPEVIRNQQPAYSDTQPHPESGYLEQLNQGPRRASEPPAPPANQFPESGYLGQLNQRNTAAVTSPLREADAIMRGAEPPTVVASDRYVAGTTKDQRELVVSPKVPETLTLKSPSRPDVTIDPRKPLGVHEFREQASIDKLGYPAAHRKALIAEKLWFAKQGLMDYWDNYQRQMEQVYQKVQHGPTSPIVRPVDAAEARSEYAPIGELEKRIAANPEAVKRFTDKVAPLVGSSQKPTTSPVPLVAFTPKGAEVVRKSVLSRAVSGRTGLSPELLKGKAAGGEKGREVLARVPRVLPDLRPQSTQAVTPVEKAPAQVANVPERVPEHKPVVAEKGRVIHRDQREELFDKTLAELDAEGHTSMSARAAAETLRQARGEKDMYEQLATVRRQEGMDETPQEREVRLDKEAKKDLPKQDRGEGDKRDMHWLPDKGLDASYEKPTLNKGVAAIQDAERATHRRAWDIVPADLFKGHDITTPQGAAKFITEVARPLSRKYVEAGATTIQRQRLGKGTEAALNYAARTWPIKFTTALHHIANKAMGNAVRKDFTPYQWSTSGALKMSRFYELYNTLRNVEGEKWSEPHADSFVQNLGESAAEAGTKFARKGESDIARQMITPPGEKAWKLKNLVARPGTEGERIAAQAALDRILAKHPEAGKWKPERTLRQMWDDLKRWDDPVYQNKWWQEEGKAKWEARKARAAAFEKAREERHARETERFKERDIVFRGWNQALEDVAAQKTRSRSWREQQRKEIYDEFYKRLGEIDARYGHTEVAPRQHITPSERSMEAARRTEDYGRQLSEIQYVREQLKDIERYKDEMLDAEKDYDDAVKAWGEGSRGARAAHLELSQAMGRLDRMLEDKPLSEKTEFLTQADLGTLPLKAEKVERLYDLLRNTKYGDSTLSTLARDISEKARNLHVYTVGGREHIVLAREGTGTIHTGEAYYTSKFDHIVKTSVLDEGPGRHYAHGEVLIHEAIHAITMRELYANKALAGLADQLRAEIKQALKVQTGGTKYALGDNYELVAMGMGNPAFRELITAVPLSKDLATKLSFLPRRSRSLWEGFKGLLAKAMDLMPTPARMSALEGVLRVYDNASSGQAANDSMAAVGERHYINNPAQYDPKGYAKKVPQSHMWKRASLTNWLVERSNHLFGGRDNNPLFQVHNLLENAVYRGQMHIDTAAPLFDQFKTLAKQDPLGADQFVKAIFRESELAKYGDQLLKDQGRADPWQKGQHPLVANDIAALPTEWQGYRDVFHDFMQTRNDLVRHETLTNNFKEITNYKAPDAGVIAERIANDTYTPADETLFGYDVIQRVQEINRDLDKYKGPYIGLHRDGSKVVHGLYKTADPAPTGDWTLRPGTINTYDFIGPDAKKNADTFAGGQERKPLAMTNEWIDVTTGRNSYEVPSVVQDAKGIDHTVMKRVRFTKDDSLNDPNVQRRYTVAVNNRYARFFDKRRHAKEHVRELNATGEFVPNTVDWVSKAKFSFGGSDVSRLMMPHIMEGLSSSPAYQAASHDVKKSMESALHQAFLSATAATSATNTRMRRVGVGGYNLDFLQGLNTFNVRSGHQLGQIETQPRIDQHMRDAWDIARSGGPMANERVKFVEEMQRRIDAGKSFKSFDPGVTWQGRAVQRLLSLSFMDKLWDMAFNTINFLQSFTHTLPFGKGDFGTGFRQEFFKNMWDLGLWRQGSLGGAAATGKAILGNTNIDRVGRAIQRATPEIQALIKTLQERRTLDRDTAMQMEHRSGMTGPLDKALNYFTGIASAWPQSIEVMNRLGAGVTAYKMARRRGETVEGATNTAQHFVNKTQGSYTAVNQPVELRGNLGKSANQFRTFMHNQIQIMGDVGSKIVHNADKGDRASALLGYALHSAVIVTLAGGLGLYTEPARLANIFGRALGMDWRSWDELEGAARRFVMEAFESAGMGEKIAQRAETALMRGVPRAILGVDMSSKMGQTGVTFSNPKAGGSDTQQLANTKAWTFDTVTGPVGSFILDRVWNMPHSAIKGEYMDALRYAMPAKWAKNVIVALQRQDPKLSPRGQEKAPAYTFGETFARGVMGLTPTIDAELGEARSASWMEAERTKEAHKKVLDDFIGAKTPEERGAAANRAMEAGYNMGDLIKAEVRARKAVNKNVNDVPYRSEKDRRRVLDTTRPYMIERPPR